MSVLFGAGLIDNQLWYLAPLVIAISLVYGATRHELMGPILHHALRAAIWMAGFMAIIFTLILVISWNL